jgi:hypothetical protein
MVRQAAPKDAEDELHQKVRPESFHAKDSIDGVSRGRSIEYLNGFVVYE